MRTNKSERKTYLLSVANDIHIDAFKCPITTEIMTDPVMAADGHTYERSAMAQWLRDHHNISPLTGAVLIHKRLTPNLTLKKAIEEYRENSASWALKLPPILVESPSVWARTEAAAPVLAKPAMREQERTLKIVEGNVPGVAVILRMITILKRRIL